MAKHPDRKRYEQANKISDWNIEHIILVFLVGRNLPDAIINDSEQCCEWRDVLNKRKPILAYLKNANKKEFPKIQKLVKALKELWESID